MSVEATRASSVGLSTTAVIEPSAVDIRTRALEEELQRGGFSAAVRDRLITIFSPVGLLVIWELFCRTGLLDTRFFPAPSSITETLWTMLANGTLLGHAGATVYRVLVGLVIGCTVGIATGLVMGLIRPIRLAIMPMLAVTMPIPKIAILPLLMLILGLGDNSKIAVVAIGVFFIMVYNTLAGVVSIPHIYLDVGKSFEASRLNFYRTVAIPGALPLMMTGFKLSFAVGLLVVVPAEWSGTRQGLGFLIFQAWNTFAIVDLWVGLVALGVLGYLAGLLLEEVERWLVPWRL